MKKKIALVTGGYSKEAEISYKSLITVNNALDRSLFDVFVIDITTDGWFYTNSNNEKTTVSKQDFSVIENNEKINFDAALMCIHGTPGEDGKLQGYFDMLNLPYTCCNAATSAITFNKRYTVASVAFSGIAVAKSVHIFKHSPLNAQQVLQQIQLPAFVKPNNGGSSIGMSLVENPELMQDALDRAFAEDNQVLVEEKIEGREFTIGVYKTNGKIIALPITEIVTQNKFFDFTAKYKGESQEITPANITQEVKQQVEEAAIKIYEVLNCNGVVRVDFIYNSAANKPYMLEVNTVPGQSAESLIPQQVAAAGMQLSQFYTLLVQECFNK